MMRKPSCLISCSHWPPEGSLSVLVGRHGAMNPAGKVRCNICKSLELRLKVKQRLAHLCRLGQRLCSQLTRPVATLIVRIAYQGIGIAKILLLLVKDRNVNIAARQIIES